MAEKWEDIRDSILSTIEGRAKDFLKDNAAAKDRLRERAERLAKLAFRYATISDEAARKTISDDMVVVRQTMENEIAALALSGSNEAKNVFKQIAGTAFDMVIKALPAIIGAL
jgi:hypothetical protein